MRRNIALLLLCLLSLPAFASSLSICDYFTGKTGCFLLYNVNQDMLLTQYNPTRCAVRISPNSTFKIPLALMAFDQKLISQKSIFKWDNKDKGRAAWNQDQTPISWLGNSVVWVSQDLAAKLGEDKIKTYLMKFNYGNQDFSGDPGKHNGLNKAWLDSSLSISADEQLVFLKKLIANMLPVSQEAMQNTKQNMYLETSAQGWKLYGKTGSGKPRAVAGTASPLQEGWFVGFIEKQNQMYIFVLNFADLQDPKVSDSAGPRAKEIVKGLLTKMNLF